jgi:ferritin-like metal-binding protein YciE
MALADAAEKAKLPRLFLVHNEGTQNQIAAVKRVAISVANDNNLKSCHSDQISLNRGRYGA